MQLPLPVVVALLVAAGLLLSRIRFCMVAAVAQARQGVWTTAQAIASICLTISAVLLASNLVGRHTVDHLPIHGRVVVGALLFGFAAAWNQGCFVGTSIQLSTGDGSALWPVVGWVLGFRLLGQPAALPLEPHQASRILIALLVLAVGLAWMVWRTRVSAVGQAAAPQHSVDWRATWVCGLLLGVIDNDLWRWDPSALARALSHPLALVHSGVTPLLGFALLLGMALDAVRQRQFVLRGPSFHAWPRLFYGIAMAVGAGLAIGGNDTQLLRYAPGGSPHGWLAVALMVVGIFAGLNAAPPLRGQSRA